MICKLYLNTLLNILCRNTWHIPMLNFNGWFSYKNNYRIYSNVMRTFFGQIMSRKLGCTLDSIANLKNTADQYIHLKCYDTKENIWLKSIINVCVLSLFSFSLVSSRVACFSFFLVSVLVKVYQRRVFFL
jgi:hypothetical protein